MALAPELRRPRGPHLDVRIRPPRRSCRGRGRPGCGRARQEVVRVRGLAGRRRPGGGAGRDHQGQPRQGRDELPHLPPRPRERRRRVRRRHRARLLLQGRPLLCPQAVRRDMVQDQGQQDLRDLRLGGVQRGGFRRRGVHRAVERVEQLRGHAGAGQRDAEVLAGPPVPQLPPRLHGVRLRHILALPLQRARVSRALSRADFLIKKKELQCHCYWQNGCRKEKLKNKLVTEPEMAGGLADCWWRWGEGRCVLVL